jgi:hypothetical protein
MKSVYILIILLISTLLISASGCQSEQYKAIELIPAKSNLIAGIQVSKIVNDQDIISAYDSMEKEADQPETFDKAMDKLFEESGMRIRDFSFAWIFGDINDVEQTEYIGFIAEGTFNEDEFMKNVEERSGERFSTSDYKGHKLYTGKSEDFSITFLNDTMLLGGSPGAVRDSIDVGEGDSQPVKGQLLDTYNRYGNALISLAMEVPEDARESLTDEPIMGDIPVSMDVFSSIDVVGFSLNKENDTLNSLIELHFLEADSVQDAQDTISGLISMFKGMMEEPDLKEFLGNIEVSASGSWLTIALETELTQLEEMIETFEE